MADRSNQRTGESCGLVLLFASVLALSGCGFQLRGVTELPAGLQTVYLAAEPAPAEFRDALESGLQSAGARIIGQPSEQGSVLRIMEVIDDRRVLSVNSITGKVQEYELGYRVRFSVADSAGTVLVKPQDVNLTRDFRFSETEVLGKSQEEAQLKREMHREAVSLLLRRLSAQLR